MRFSSLYAKENNNTKPNYVQVWESLEVEIRKQEGFLLAPAANLMPLNQAWSSSQELPMGPLIYYSQGKVKVTNCQPIPQVLEMLIANHNNELLLKTAEVIILSLFAAREFLL